MLHRLVGVGMDEWCEHHLGEKRWLETRNERIVRNNGRTIHIFVIVNTRCVGIGFFAKLEGGAKVYKIGIMLDRESSLENIVLEG